MADRLTRIAIVSFDRCKPKKCRQECKKSCPVVKTDGEVLNQKDERDMKEELCADLELNQVIERNVGDLSGGELQRFAIAVVAIQNAEIYMFDEPSSYLDVKQRLKAAQVVRSLLRANSRVIVVEHDLSVLDYLSDFTCCLYGKPGAYGVVTLPFSVREGINIFLAGCGACRDNCALFQVH